VFYSLIGGLDPKLHFNDGMREVVKFIYAPNTVTNASAPAPVSSYQAANLKLTDVILEALAAFRPERAVANGGASGAMLISWKEGGRPGQPSLQYEILGSAYGGGNGNDGASAVATHTSNLHITPIEILETNSPVASSNSTWFRTPAALESSAVGSHSGASTNCCKMRR